MNRDVNECIESFDTVFHYVSTPDEMQFVTSSIITNTFKVLPKLASDRETSTNKHTSKIK